ncbi:MAG: hypothetical protein J1D99_02410 [Campylobacter sp.]|nr:hypothetical protein [Campylobacter sp.]
MMEMEADKDLKMALDFSSAKFSLLPSYVSVYKNLETNFDKQSKEELKALDESLKPQNLNDKVKQAQSGMVNIYFRDPITQNITQSALSEESIKKLKESFEASDFYQRKDGSYILNGKAENFVSGWYGDIAYQRGYLAADENKDGYMDKDELDNTRSGFQTHGWVVVSHQNKEISTASTYLESYIKLNGISTAADGVPMSFKDNQKTFYNQGKFAEATLALELDKTIKNDKDLDGIVSYGEIFTLEEMIQADNDSVEYVLGGGKEAFARNYSDPTEGALTLFDLMLRDKSVSEAFNKLVENDFDISKLSEEELKDFKNDFKEFFNENDEFDVEKFKEFYENFQNEFINKSLKFLGLSKKDYNEGTLNLDFNKLHSILQDIFNTFKEANATKANFKDFTLDLKI